MSISMVSRAASIVSVADFPVWNREVELFQPRSDPGGLLEPPLPLDAGTGEISRSVVGVMSWGDGSGEGVQGEGAVEVQAAAGLEELRSSTVPRLPAMEKFRVFSASW